MSSSCGFDAEEPVADVAADEKSPSAFPRDRFRQAPGYVESQRVT